MGVDDLRTGNAAKRHRHTTALTATSGKETDQTLAFIEGASRPKLLTAHSPFWVTHLKLNPS